MDVQFFNRAFIGSGAVTWPDNIDFARDVLYAEVVSEGKGRDRAS